MNFHLLIKPAIRYSTCTRLADCITCICSKKNKFFSVSSTTRRNLSVTVSSLYNNTEILCRAIGDPNVKSNTAILTVQGNKHAHDNQQSLLSLISGPLSSVDGLSYSFIDSSTINISWSPPFTLPGTHITGYTISVTTSNGTTTDYYTSNSYYVLLLTDITDSPYNDFTSQVTVSGYNGLVVGSENSSIISEKPHCYTTACDIDLLFV